MRSNTSTEQAAKRRFTILVLLHTRPHTYGELVAALTQKRLLEDNRSTNAPPLAGQQRYQFRRDLAALRLMGCQIECDRSSKRYTWRNSPFGLCLSQAQLSIFALLLDTFADTLVLHGTDIQALLTYFIKLLPPEQQKALTPRHGSFTIDLHETTDYRNTDPKTLSHIEKSIELGRQLEFCYRASRDGKERRHVIEPKPLVFERGHVYLYGWSIDYDKELRFRLDYIIPGTAHSIPIPVRLRPSRNTYPLRYYLSPVIARNKVSQHFPNQVVETHPDGSATVTAQITDLFEARRILLSYGANCTVLEPPALVEEMRTIAAALYKIYHTPGE